MSEILLRLRVEGATHSSLWNTRWKRHAMEHNTSTAHRQVPRTLRASGGRRRPTHHPRQKAAGAAPAAELPLPLGERPLGGLAIASYLTAASDVRCLCGVHLKRARRAESGQECAASGAWGQARDISPSGLSQLQRVRFVRKGVAECQDTPQRQRSPLSPKANTTPAHRRDTAPAAGPQTLSPPAAG